MTEKMNHWTNTMNHKEIIWHNVFADFHSTHLRLKLFLISRFGSVWCLGLFWWVQPHWTPGFVSRSPADCNSSHLQKGTPQNLCLHWWRYSGHEPRVWHVPHHGQFSVYVPMILMLKLSKHLSRKSSSGLFTGLSKIIQIILLDDTVL